ncbi:hypothetical protein GN956_G547 [Arapaima gigas]
MRLAFHSGSRVKYETQLSVTSSREDTARLPSPVCTRRHWQVRGCRQALLGCTSRKKIRSATARTIM